LLKTIHNLLDNLYIHNKLSNIMKSLIVFCNPHLSYRGGLIEEVAREYTRMAIEEYDALVSFAPEYLQYAASPDANVSLSKKEGRNIELSVFAMQPLVRVGYINSHFESSSYLFNPESENQNMFLPDLDVVEIKGKQNVKEAANTIECFYKKFGWNVYVFDGKIDKKIEVKPNSERFSGPIKIFDPNELRHIAKEKVKYDLEKLCF